MPPIAARNLQQLRSSRLTDRLAMAHEAATVIQRLLRRVFTNDVARIRSVITTCEGSVTGRRSS